MKSIPLSEHYKNMSPKYTYNGLIAKAKAKGLFEEEYLITNRDLEVNLYNGKIFFYKNFNFPKEFSESEILNRWFQFYKKYNGLIDVKFDAGLGLMNQGLIPSPFSNEKINMSDDTKQKLAEKYCAGVNDMNKASECIEKVSLIVEL